MRDSARLAPAIKGSSSEGGGMAEVLFIALLAIVGLLFILGLILFALRGE